MFGRRGRAQRAVGRQNQLGLALLALQIFQFGIDRIPLVTLVTLLTNIGVYVHIPELFDIPLPKVHDICISYQGVVLYREYSRLVLSGFYHLSDMHLYYNMASLLYKGSQLEPRLGSGRFAGVIGVLLVGSSVVYCALQYCAAQLLGPAHLHTCAAGFSCVLFGLKVLLQNEGPASHRLFGIPIHMAYWSELIWISLISPQASFVGHLAGILTGLLLTYGPLSFVTRGTVPAFFRTGGGSARTWGSGVASGTGSGSTGASSHSAAGGRYNTSQQPEEDAELQEAVRRSLLDETRDTGPRGYTPASGPRGYTPAYTPMQPSAPPYIPDTTSHHTGSHHTTSHDPSQPPRLPADLDEIRRRRLQHFQ